jgi:hypothetical protein
MSNDKIEEVPRELLLQVGQKFEEITIPEEPLEFSVKGKQYSIQVVSTLSEEAFESLDLYEGETRLGGLLFFREAWRNKGTFSWFVRYLNAANMMNATYAEIPGGSEAAKAIRAADPNRPPIGTLLMKSLEELAKLNNIKAIELQVGWNAEPFYTKLGFSGNNTKMEKVLSRRSRRSGRKLRQSRRKSRHSRRSRRA